MISRHPDVAQVAVVGVPDEHLGEVGFAYVIPRQGRTLTEAELIAWTAERWPTSRSPGTSRSSRRSRSTPAGKY